MENLASFYDSTTGDGFFNLKQQENMLSDKELHGLLQVFASHLDLDELLDQYFIQSKMRIPVTGIRMDGIFTVVNVGDKSESNSQKSLEVLADGSCIATLTYYFEDALSLREQQVLKELHRLVKAPLKNALTFSQLKQMSMKDPLTSLGNRGMYNDMLVKLCSQAHRTGENLTLMALDLDHFKPVNDAHGHVEGDKVLVAVANAIHNSLRNSDHAFRFGGDEFCCLIQNSDKKANEKIVGRIQNAIKNNVLLKKHNVTCSIGVADLEASDSPESLFSRADKALYNAKSSGRDCAINA